MRFCRQQTGLPARPRRPPASVASAADATPTRLRSEVRGGVWQPTRSRENWIRLPICRQLNMFYSVPFHLLLVLFCVIFTTVIQYKWDGILIASIHFTTHENTENAVWPEGKGGGGEGERGKEYRETAVFKMVERKLFPSSQGQSTFREKCWRQEISGVTGQDGGGKRVPGGSEAGSAPTPSSRAPGDPHRACVGSCSPCTSVLVRGGGAGLAPGAGGGPELASGSWKPSSRI